MICNCLLLLQTKDIFEKLMPGEDFLPRPPNPEDIIYIDDAESTVPDSTNKSDFTDSSKATSQSETENSNQLENNNPVNDQSEADSANSTTDQTNETKSDKLETEKDIENKSD